MELKKETERQRKFVKEIFWPFLLERSENIEDAKAFCIVAAQSLQIAYDVKIMEEQKRLSKSQVSILNMEEAIEKNSRYDRDREFIRLFATESIAVTESLLRGMAKEIDGFVQGENKTRKLNELKTNWL